MASVRILSVNCQGLGNIVKRTDVFNYLKKKQCNIYCLQDTHFTCENEKSIRSSWDYECYFSSFTSNARGTAILFNNNFEFNILKEKRDINGNYLVLDINVDKINFTLVSIYGPNDDNPQFYENIMSIVEEFGNENFIICGDFNLVLCPELDYCNYLHVNNPKSREKVLELIEERSLIDPYRQLYPDSFRYTWRKKNPFRQARLDFFLFTESMLTNLKNCTIDPSYRSDHSMIILSLVFNPFNKGKGLWKFNNSLLYEKDYSKIVREKIIDLKKQYAALIYNRDKIQEIDDNELQLTINVQLFLEMLLLEIRGKTISFASYIKKIKEQRFRDLQEEIATLEKNVTENSIENLETKKHELESLRNEKMKGKLVRSRAQWVDEGEKPTKYFCGLESKNYTSKIIPKVEKDNGEIVTDQKEILKEVQYFYENLYKNKDEDKGCSLKDIVEGLKGASIRKLTEEEKDNLEGEIGSFEAGEILKKMKNNKSPGSDGFTSEFLKFFWKDLKVFVIGSLNYGYSLGSLSVTQKQGIITCLPKGDKSRHFLKNWQPISLLNTVYKIGSGVIANRIKKVLPTLINNDQTGFIAGRYIGENIRLLFDIMEYAEENDIPGLFLLIDFEKAFDSISWNFLNNILKFFNFGESIQKWVKTFYNNIKSAVNQGGNLSDFFSIERGCRQGDPLSPYLFILCAEIMAIKIRENPKIKGIKVLHSEHEISQFADDTSVILDGSEESLNETLLELEWFKKISGLKINFSKTQVIWIGSKKYSSDRLCENWNLSWGKTTFTVLGINFDVDISKITKINYEKYF